MVTAGKVFGYTYLSNNPTIDGFTRQAPMLEPQLDDGSVKQTASLEQDDSGAYDIFQNKRTDEVGHELRSEDAA